MQPIPPFRLTLTRLALLGALSLLASCQTFTDGDQQLYDQSNRLLDESLAQSRGKVAPPAAVQAALMAPPRRGWMWRSRTCRRGTSSSV